MMRKYIYRLIMLGQVSITVKVILQLTIRFSGNYWKTVGFIVSISMKGNSFITMLIDITFPRTNSFTLLFRVELQLWLRLRLDQTHNSVGRVANEQLTQYFTLCGIVRSNSAKQIFSNLNKVIYSISRNSRNYFSQLSVFSSIITKE